MTEWLTSYGFWFVLGLVLLILEWLSPGVMVLFFGLGALLVGADLARNRGNPALAAELVCAAQPGQPAAAEEALPALDAGHGNRSGRRPGFQ